MELEDQGCNPTSIHQRPEARGQRPEAGGWGPEAEGRQDKQGCTYILTDGQKVPICVVQGIVPFGAAAQKGRKKEKGRKVEKGRKGER